MTSIKVLRISNIPLLLVGLSPTETEVSLFRQETCAHGELKQPYHQSLRRSLEDEESVDVVITLKISKEDMLRIHQPFGSTIIAKVIDKTTGFKFFDFNIRELWSLNREMKVINLGKDFYAMKFTNENKEDWRLVAPNVPTGESLIPRKKLSREIIMDKKEMAAQLHLWEHQNMISFSMDLSITTKATTDGYPFDSLPDTEPYRANRSNLLPNL
ncbi:hypothetical protein ACH5RR_041177 [Cinchona calisaya]|uniref:Uncharacterized protein n=1 Tax=Cinchona calisaya TaxID=153742 RepID=A0ABD2XY82_9GENT